MSRFTHLLAPLGLVAGLLCSTQALSDELERAVDTAWDKHLGELYDYFHRNPELSMLETRTAARLAAQNL